LEISLGSSPVSECPGDRWLGCRSPVPN
jgi:hypothetical protein